MLRKEGARERLRRNSGLGMGRGDLLWEGDAWVNGLVWLCACLEEKGFLCRLRVLSWWSRKYWLLRTDGRKEMSPWELQILSCSPQEKAPCRLVTFAPSAGLTLPGTWEVVIFKCVFKQMRYNTFDKSADETLSLIGRNSAQLRGHKRYGFCFPLGAHWAGASEITMGSNPTSTLINPETLDGSLKT